MLTYFRVICHRRHSCRSKGTGPRNQSFHSLLQDGGWNDKRKGPFGVGRDRVSFSAWDEIQSIGLQHLNKWKGGALYGYGDR